MIRFKQVKPSKSHTFSYSIALQHNHVFFKTNYPIWEISDPQIGVFRKKEKIEIRPEEERWVAQREIADEGEKVRIVATSELPWLLTTLISSESESLSFCYDLWETESLDYCVRHESESAREWVGGRHHEIDDICT